MMNVIRVVIIVILMLIGSSVSAQNTSKETRVKFYDFDEMLVDGKIKKPIGLLMNAKKNVKFNMLINNDKRSFIKELENTAKEKSFK